MENSFCGISAGHQQNITRCRCDENRVGHPPGFASRFLFGGNIGHGQYFQGQNLYYYPHQNLFYNPANNVYYAPLPPCYYTAQAVPSTEQIDFPPNVQMVNNFHVYQQREALNSAPPLQQQRNNLMPTSFKQTNLDAPVLKEKIAMEMSVRFGDMRPKTVYRGPIGRQDYLPI